MEKGKYLIIAALASFIVFWGPLNTVSAQTNINVSVTRISSVVVNNAETNQTTYVYRMNVTTDSARVRASLSGRLVFDQMVSQSGEIEIELTGLLVGDNELEITLTDMVDGEERVLTKVVNVKVVPATIPGIEVPNTGYLRIGSAVYDKTSSILVAFFAALAVTGSTWFMWSGRRRKQEATSKVSKIQKSQK